MESLVGYGSDDDVETERSIQHASVGQSSRRREDDTNYDDVNMDLSEESQSVESEPELPPAESAPRPSRDDRRGSNDSRDKERTRDLGRDRTRDGPRDRERHREGPRDRERDGQRDRRRDGETRHERDRRSPKRDDRHNRGDRSRCSQDSRRGLLGDRPEDKSETKMPALMDLKPYDGEPPPGARGHDARDAVSPRFTERGRRDRDRERERDRDRHSRRSEERRGGRGSERSDRSRSRGAAFPPPQAMCSNDRDKRGSPPSGDYRPSSYKVNRKLEVMEKMGLQIKTPDGSMATAQQLRAAASEAPSGLPPYYNPAAVTSNKALDQKRKLLWSHKEKNESGAACWSGARFSQDADGRQVSKFMRLMGIKDAAAAAAKPEVPEADPNKKQEELFQAMQAQYEVARATTHTMRGVGLGFQRGNF